MRTLKKVLALTVVLATVFSLTAFAAFTDADQINESCQDDINLMNALNVMVGDAEGTFRPNGTISRAEAAKMVYVVRNGGVDDKASGWTGMKVFNDVPAGAWYEGYVNYCASLGIIAGVGGNRFNPDGAVTGVELAKMLLVVAGYKPDVQGYTGANWSLNVINDAQQAYMFEGYALAFSASAPRQWAAKLFSNAILKTQTAVYFNGELVNGLSAFGSASTIGQKYFSLQTVTGDLISTYHASVSGGLQDNKAGAVNVSAINAITRTTDKDGTVSTSYVPRSFAYDVPASLLGQEVTVVYKESGDKSNLDEKDTVYDVYATGTTNMVTVTRDAATIDGTTLKLAGVNGGRAVEYKGEKFVMLSDDGYTVEEITVASKDDLAKLFKASNENVTLIFGDKNLIKYAFVENANYAFIDKIDLDKGQFTLRKATSGSTFKLKDENNKDLAFGNTTAGKQQLADYVVVPSNLEAGNLVKYTVSGKTGKLVYTFEAMSPAASGAMTVRNSDTKATIGGASYSLGQAASDLLYTEMPALNLEETFYVYTDGKYAVYVTNETGATSSKISSKMAYVIKKSDNAKDDWGADVEKVQVLLADGTNKVYTYKKITKDAPAGYIAFASVLTSKYANQKVYEYVISGDSIYFVDFSYTEADAAYNQNLSASKFSVKNQRFGSIPVDGNSYFFYANDTTGEYKVVRAADLMDEAVLDAANTATIAVNNIPTVAFGVATSLGANTGTAVYAFTRSPMYTGVSDGKVVDMIDVTLSTGEEISAIINNGSPVQGEIYKVTPVNDQYKFESASIADDAADLAVGKLKAASSTLALVNITATGANVKEKTSTAFNITADTQIFYVDESGKSAEPATPAKLTDAFELEKDLVVKLSVDANGNILAMYVTKAADKPAGDTKIEGAQSLTIAAPEAGTKLPSELKLDAANYTAALTWTPDETAVAGTEYTVKVVLTAKAGYVFDDAVTVSVNKAAAAKPTLSADKKTATIEGIKVTATKALTPIDAGTVELTFDTSTLKTGDAWIKATKVNGGTNINADIGTVTTEWTYVDGKDTKTLADGDKVTGGVEYTVTVTLEAGTDKKFVSANAYEVKLGAAAAAAATLKDGKLVFTEKVTPKNAEITELTLTLDKLAANMKFDGEDKDAPEASVSEKSVDVATVWKNGSAAATGTATAGNTYQVVITITAKDGYAFRADFEDTDITATGIASEYNYATSAVNLVDVAEGTVTITLSIALP